MNLTQKTSRFLNLAAQQCRWKSTASSQWTQHILRNLAACSNSSTSDSPLLTRSCSSFSRFPVPDKSSLPQDLQDTITDVEEKVGFVPNVHACYTNRPEEFRAFFNYYDVLMNKDTGNLTKADREMIVIATSAANGCLYCVISHSAFHRIYAKNPVLADQLAANWRTADISDRERAILDFAMEICDCRTPTCDHYSALEQHGLTQDDAWDIGAVTSFFALSNRMAFLTELKPNKEFYLLGRVPKAVYDGLADGYGEK